MTSPAAAPSSNVNRNRRRHFLINKPLQLRYMAYIGTTLGVVSVALIASLYFGIWGGILDAFGDTKVREDLLTASRLVQYEEARLPSPGVNNNELPFFKQADRLSQRQREVFKDILDDTNRKLLYKYLFLFLLLCWGTIYISHKIAGPLYRFDDALNLLGKGDLKTRIRLRQFDETQFLADKFNATIENYDLLFSRLKQILKDSPNDSQRLIARLDEELSKIKTSHDPTAP